MQALRRLDAPTLEWTRAVDLEATETPDAASPETLRQLGDGYERLCGAYLQHSTYIWDPRGSFLDCKQVERAAPINKVCRR